MIFDKLLLDPGQIVELIVVSLKKSKPLLLTYFNQHCFNVYWEDANYRHLLDNKFETFQADLGIFLAFKFFKKKKVKRIDATAINQKIINLLIQENISIGIVGGNFESEFIRKKTNEKSINIVTYFDGFFKEDQNVNIINSLKSSNCQVYIIGMGVPRQEVFAEKLSDVSTSSIIICVGNFLEFYFGTKKRAPVFFQNLGIEWIFRLATEPIRLWKRYLIGIPVFFYRILKLKFSAVHF